MHPYTYGAALCVLGGGMSFGLLASVVNLGLARGFSVGEITGMQQLSGAVMVWLLSAFWRRHWQKIDGRTVLALMAVGSLSGLTGIFYYNAMAHSSVSTGIVLLFQFTWIGVLLEWLFDKRNPRPTTYVSLLMLIVGTALAANMFSDTAEDFSWTGVAYGLLSAVTFALYLYLSGKTAPHLSPWQRSPMMVTGSCLLILCLFPPVYLTAETLAAGLGWIGFASGLLGAVIPPICFAAGTPHLKPGTVTILSSVELPTAVLAAWLIVHETVLPKQWLGVFLILAAIALHKNADTGKRKRHPVNRIEIFKQKRP